MSKRILVTDEQKEAFRVVYNKMNAPKDRIEILLNGFNDYYGYQVYTIDDLHCRDCMNTVINFYKYAINGK